MWPRISRVYTSWVYTAKPMVGWLRMLVYSPTTFWHEKEWNILTCVLKLPINLHPPTSGWYISKNTCVTCHLWHFFQQNAWKNRLFLVWSRKIHWTFFGSLLELRIQSNPIHTSIDFQDSVMMISLIWPLRAKGRNRIWESVDLHFCWEVVGLRVHGKWDPFWGVSNVWLGGGFEHFFIFNPENWGDDPIWQLRICFKDVVKQRSN